MWAVCLEKAACSARNRQSAIIRVVSRQVAWFVFRVRSLTSDRCEHFNSLNHFVSSSFFFIADRPSISSFAVVNASCTNPNAMYTFPFSKNHCQCVRCSRHHHSVPLAYTIESEISFKLRASGKLQGNDPFELTRQKRRERRMLSVIWSESTRSSSFCSMFQLNYNVSVISRRSWAEEFFDSSVFAIVCVSAMTTDNNNWITQL